MGNKEWTPPPPRKCPYHPDVTMEWVQKHSGKTRKSKLWWVERCEECEWNSPFESLGSSHCDDGNTSPEIKTHLQKLGDEPEDESSVGEDVMRSMQRLDRINAIYHSTEGHGNPSLE